MTDSATSTQNNQVVTVTESAVEEIKRLMSQEKEESLYLRLSVTAGGCSGMSYNMAFDSKKGQFDREFEYFGIKVLVDLQALRHLNGTKLDFKGGLLGGGFSFENPNAKRSCGCGSSFTC